MPKKSSRLLRVGDRRFCYALTGRSRYRGSSAGSMRLVVDLADRHYCTATFVSKLWNEMHEDGLAIHSLAFTPRNVREFLDWLLAGPAALSFETGEWRLSSLEVGGFRRSA